MDRQERIIHYLRIKECNSGEIEIDIVKTEDQIIPPIKERLIKDTLKEQGINLIPIIIRRLSQEDPDENEYDCVYGQEWVIIAKELGIVRLNAWVMDVTDEEIPALQERMKMMA